MGLELKMAELLRPALEPEELEIINESHLHRGHSGDDGSGQSHFLLVIVSAKFEGLTRIQRHRLVTQILGEQIHDIHAMSLKLFSPSEKKRNKK